MAEWKSRIEKPTVFNGSLCHAEINFYAGYCPAKFMAFNSHAMFAGYCPAKLTAFDSFLCHVYVMTNSFVGYNLFYPFW